ncbi:hypothetical protein HDU98_001601, partial [Podochytrium sp. JEL0797]
MNHSEDETKADPMDATTLKDSDSENEAMETDVKVDPVEAALELKQRANERYKAGDYRQAAELYGEAIDISPSDSPAKATLLANRSAAFTMSRSHALAVRDCRASLLMDPKQKKLYLRGAKALVFMGDVEAARAMLEDAKKEMPGDVKAWEDEIKTLDSIESNITRSKSLLETKSFLAALESVESAFLLADPSNARQTRLSTSASRLLNADLGNFCHKWNLLRAECLIGLLELAEASKVVSNRVLSYDSTNSEALALRAQILYLNDSHPLVNVIQFLTQALTFDPDCKRARVFLKTIKALEAKKKEGNEAYGKQEWEEAELKYSEWLDLDSVGGVVRCKVLSNRAMVRSKTSRHPECISDCKTAITLLTTLSFPSNPTSPPPEPTNADLANTLQHALFLKLHLRRADSHLKLEEYTEALRDYQLCSEIDPENREIAAAVQSTKKAERAAKRKDYYKILGCPRDADESAIKKAYRKMALIYHPDKQAALPEEERATCDSKFKEVAEAYSVLSDPQKKAMFDNGHDVDGASAS